MSKTQPIAQDRAAIIERWRTRRGARRADARAETLIDIVSGVESVIVTSNRGSDIVQILERAGDHATARDKGDHVRILIPRELVGSVAAWIKSAARSANTKAQRAA